MMFVGVRNPLDRNLSYFFQGYRYKIKDDVKTKYNEYEGYSYYYPKLYQKSISDTIEFFMVQKFHNVLEEWFREFCEVTGISLDDFDKDKGLSYYYVGNIKIIVYTLEKLKNNEKEICKLIGIDKLMHSNNHENRKYKNIYKTLKSEIVYSENHVDRMLFSPIARKLYSEEDLEGFKRNVKLK